MVNQEDNVIDLEEAVKARRRKEPPTGNWLSELPKDTRFLASLKGVNSSTLGDFLVASDPKEMAAVVLGYELGHRDGGFRWVDPVKFSRDYDFYMTVEITDGNSSEIPTGTVASDGDVEIIHPVHEVE